jgi:hypothetical protein
MARPDLAFTGCSSPSALTATATTTLPDQFFPVLIG